MGGRDVRLMPAPDANHSPALSSWFRLLSCLDESSHAKGVSGAGQQLSLSQGLALPGAPAEGLKVLGRAKPGLAACSPEVSGLRVGCRGGSWGAPQPCPSLQMLSCTRQPSCGRAGGQVPPVPSNLFLCVLSPVS